MSSYASYYYYTSAIILLDGICDIIFKVGVLNCDFKNNKVSLFLFMGILNIIACVFMWAEGFLINYYLNLTPDETKSMGIINKILAICSKVFPMLIKLIHFVKTLICLICIYFAFFSNELEGENFAASNTTSTECQNATLVAEAKIQYKRNIKIFEIIELSSVFIVIVICGCAKQVIDIDGEYYIPKRPGSSKWKTLLFRQLGP